MQEVHRRKVVRLSVCAAVAASCVVGSQLMAPAVRPVAAPCVNGVVPLNPYVQNCNLPTRQPRVRGAAPDAGAIIACRGNPWCLSDYVNGQYGW